MEGNLTRRADRVKSLHISRPGGVVRKIGS